MHTGDRGVLIINYSDDFILESPSLDKNLRGKAKIYIYENEGPIPYCHVVGLKNQEICIRLDKPKYFSHGNKVGLLNSKERKLFNDFMHLKNELGVEQWKVAVSIWNGYANDDSTKIKVLIKECPNYLELE